MDFFLLIFLQIIFIDTLSAFASFRLVNENHLVPWYISVDTLAFHGDRLDRHLAGFTTGAHDSEVRILLYIVGIRNATPSAMLNCDF